MEHGIFCLGMLFPCCRILNCTCIFKNTKVKRYWIKNILVCIRREVLWFRTVYSCLLVSREPWFGTVPGQAGKPEAFWMTVSLPLFMCSPRIVLGMAQFWVKVWQSTVQFLVSTEQQNLRLHFGACLVIKTAKVLCFCSKESNTEGALWGPEVWKPLE